MWTKLVFASLLLAAVNCENAPVIFWGKSPTVLPALNNLNGDEFVALVQSKLDEKTLTLVFVESQLSVEDFSQCKLRSATCFENLSKLQDRTYLPSVESPLKALEGLSRNHKSILLSNDGDVSENIKAEGGKVVFINMEEIVSRSDFAKHDDIINELYESVAAKYDNVLAIYTSKSPSFTYSKALSRKTRQADPAPITQIVKFVNNLVYVAMSGISVKKADDAEFKSYTDFTLAAESGTEPGIMTVTITTEPADVSVTLDIHLIAGSWEVKKTNYLTGEIIFHPNHRILASDDSSFACGDLHLVGVGPDLKRTIIKMENLQMQPIFTARADPNVPFEFGQPWNCTGFFSAGIWGGLFIVFLFLTIMAYGISWIMDIKTMSQFDDPKGKTITINAAE